MVKFFHTDVDCFIQWDVREEAFYVEGWHMCTLGQTHLLHCVGKGEAILDGECAEPFWNRFEQCRQPFGRYMLGVSSPSRVLVVAVRSVCALSGRRTSSGVLLQPVLLSHRWHHLVLPSGNLNAAARHSSRQCNLTSSWWRRLCPCLDRVN